MSNLILDLYTQKKCGYCVEMKEKLTEWGYGYREINISYDDDAKQFLRTEGHRTVPQLYYDGRHLNKVETHLLTKEMLDESF